jgi:flagellar basal body-associated protein FliL
MYVQLNKLVLLIVVGLMFALGAASPGAAQEEEASGEILDEGKHKITFSPFNITVMKRGKVQGLADIQLVLQLVDNREYEELNALKPQLRSDITTALSTLARQRWSLTRPIDPDIISQYLTPFISYRVGEGRLEVYVTQALINPA